MNDDVFVAKGYEHIWASSGHGLKWAFCGCLNDVEARAYMHMASYPLVINDLCITTADDVEFSTILICESYSLQEFK